MDNFHVRRALPEGWEWKRLGDVVEILDGKRIPIKEDEREKRNAGKPVSELVPYYGATGQLGWINDYIFNEELVLLGEDGAPFFDVMKNKAYIINGKSWVNNHAHVLKAKAGVSLNSFICNYLNIFEYNGYVSGTTRTKLIQSEMRRIPIPLPPLPTQRRIVSILEKAEETKRLRAQADGLTDRLLQSVFLEMFGDPVTNPNKWEEGKLGDFFSDVRYGVSIKSSSKGFPIIGMNSISYDGRIDWNDLSKVELSPNTFQKEKLEKYDLLFNRTNASNLVGKTGIVDTDIVNSGLIFPIFSGIKIPT